jgi:hypothetical protein
MAMQYDVASVHLNQSGFGYIGRIRVKGLVISCTSTGGAVSIYDTLTAPVTTGTYGRSGTTVTVTQAAHGLNTGDKVGIAFAVGTGGSATNGNYSVTYLSSSTFSITDINSGSITGTPACTYVSNTAAGNSTQWHGSFDTAAAAGTTNIVFPGEGFLIENALYVSMTATNVTAVTVFYG